MPGPTPIAYYNQTVVVNINNGLNNIDNITLNWHSSLHHSIPLNGMEHLSCMVQHLELNQKSVASFLFLIGTQTVQIFSAGTMAHYSNQLPGPDCCSHFSCINRRHNLEMSIFRI